MSDTATSTKIAKEIIKRRGPYVEVGMSVLWYPDGTPRNGQPAIVSDLGMDSVCLNIITPSNYNFIIRDGVRHVDDPQARSQDMMDTGAWDHTPFTKKLIDLLDLGK